MPTSKVAILFFNPFSVSALTSEMRSVRYLSRLARSSVAGFKRSTRFCSSAAFSAFQSCRFSSILAKSIGDAIRKILVALGAQFGRRLQKIDALLQQRGFFRFPILQVLVHLGEVHRQLLGGPISGGQLHRVDFLP